MAFHTSLIQLKGKIRDSIYYNVDDKTRVRSAAKTYRLSEESKKASQEFGIASIAGKLIRLGLTPLIKKMSDKKFTNRLNGKLRKVIATAPGEKGSRRVIDGDLALLKGVQLSSYTRFDKLFSTPPLVSLDQLGTLHVTLQGCDTSLTMRYRPAKAKEAIIKIIVCTLDPAAGNGRVAIADDLIIDLKEPVFYESTLKLPLDDFEDRVVVTTIGIFFGGDGAESGDRNFFAAEILDACLVRDGKRVPFIYPEPVKPPVDDTTKAIRRIAWTVKKPLPGPDQTPPPAP